MAYRKRTIRRMGKTTREIARAVNEAELAIKRVKRLIPDINSMEMMAGAAAHTPGVGIRKNSMKGMTQEEIASWLRATWGDERAERILVMMAEKRSDAAVAALFP